MKILFLIVAIMAVLMSVEASRDCTKAAKDFGTEVKKHKTTLAKCARYLPKPEKKKKIEKVAAQGEDEKPQEAEEEFEDEKPKKMKRDERTLHSVKTMLKFITKKFS